MELIPGEKVSNPDRVCETTLTHATSPKVFFEYYCPLSRGMSYGASLLYLEFCIPIPYFNPLTERASSSSMHVYTYEFLFLSLQL